MRKPTRKAPRAVQVAEDGRLFIEYKVRRVGGRVDTQRRYGVWATCSKCGAEYFQYNRKSTSCSLSCSRRGRGTSKGIPRPQMMTPKSARDRADRLFSLAVRSRGACERCGSRDMKRLQCAHIISRRYLRTRWDWDNAFCLCAGCHFWGHQHPLEWEDFVTESIGSAAYDALKLRAKVYLKPDMGTWMVVVGRLEELVRSQGLAAVDDDVLDLRVLAKRVSAGAA